MNQPVKRLRHSPSGSSLGTPPLRPQRSVFEHDAYAVDQTHAAGVELESVRSITSGGPRHDEFRSGGCARAGKNAMPAGEMNGAQDPATRFGVSRFELGQHHHLVDDDAPPDRSSASVTRRGQSPPSGEVFARLHAHGHSETLASDAFPVRGRASSACPEARWINDVGRHPFLLR